MAADLAALDDLTAFDMIARSSTVRMCLRSSLVSIGNSRTLMAYSSPRWQLVLQWDYSARLFSDYSNRDSVRLFRETIQLGYSMGILSKTIQLDHPKRLPNETNRLFNDYPMTTRWLSQTPRTQSTASQLRIVQTVRAWNANRRTINRIATY